MNDDNHTQKQQLVLNNLAALENAVTADWKKLSSDFFVWFEHQGFWVNAEGLALTTGEKIALMHSELSEALEADREGLQSNHIPGFLGIEEELADVIVRVFDFAGRHKLRLGEAFFAKMRMNVDRPYRHGKRY